MSLFTERVVLNTCFGMCGVSPPALDQVRDKIRRMAGVRNPRIEVRVVDHGMLPPTIRRPRKRNGQPKFVQVVVSAQWLSKKLPKEWAAIVTARLLGLPDVLSITELKESK